MAPQTRYASDLRILQALAARYGPAYLLLRSALIDILRVGLGDLPIRMGATVTAFTQTESDVQVTLNDGTQATYDLVVGADGLRSAVRQLLFGDLPLVDQHLTSWAFWIAPRLARPGEVTEYWGLGRFCGVYPTEEKLCCFLVMSTPVGWAGPVASASRIARIQASFGHIGGLVPQILAALPSPEEIWHDDFFDLTLPHWYKGCAPS